MHAGVEGGGAGVRGAGGGACWHESAKLSITMGPPTKKDGGCDSLAGNWKSICEERQTGVRRALRSDASHDCDEARHTWLPRFWEGGGGGERGLLTRPRGFEPRDVCGSA